MSIRHVYIFLVTLATDFRRQTYITLFLAVTQQLCGQANVLSYAPLIFAAASGNDAVSSSSFVQGWATLSIGLVKFVVTVGVIWKIESLGRRFLLLVGMATIGLGLLLLAVAFAGTSVVPAKNGDDKAVEETTNGFYLALPGVLLVVCGYSMSFGPLTWLLTSELFPTDIRGRALGASTIVTYICASVVTFTFLSAQALVGASIVFFIYFLITGLGFVFALLAIPDTGGKNPEEIEDDLDGMLWWQRQTFLLATGRQNDATMPIDSKLPETEIT
jgi:Sugar (and other) transporter